MAGANPTVTAIIDAKDNASAVIDKVLQHAKGASAASVAEAGRASNAHMGTLETLARRTRSFISEIDTAAAGAFATFGHVAIHQILEVGKAMENEQRRIMSFSDTSAATMARIRKEADSTFSSVKGGPEAALSAVRTGVLSGIAADNIAAALPVINLHSVETNSSTEHGTESLIGLGNMLGTFKDEMGRVITAAAATREQFVRGMTEAENVAISANKVAPGSLQTQVDAIRVVAPAAVGMHVPREDMLAMIATLAAGGIDGSHGGQYIKGAITRLSNPTAPTRSAIASSGLHLADYRHVDPNLLNDEGIDAGLAQALGPLSESMKGHVHNLLAKFKKDSNDEALQADLTGLIRSEGGKKPPVIAANIASRVTSPSVTGVDAVRLFNDLSDKGAGVGALTAIFGKEVGGALASLLGPTLNNFRDKFREELPKDNVSHAIEENAQSYATRVEGLSNAIKGLEDQLFLGMKPAIMEGAGALTSLVQAITKLPAPIHEAMDAVLLGGTALASVKVAGTLATWASGLSRLALGAEAAAASTGPIIGALEILAGIEFLPAVAGLGLLVGAIEALNHKSEIAHAWDNLQHGTFDVPTTADEARKLADQRDTAAADVAERERNAERLQPADPQLTDMEAAQRSKIADLQVQYGDDTPEIRKAQENVTAADANVRQVQLANPLDDPAVTEAMHRLDTIEQAMKERGKFTNDKVASYQRYIEQHRNDDPDASDPDIERMKHHRAELRSALPDPNGTTPELDTLNGRIEHREAFNRAELDTKLAAANRLLEDAKTAAGAPDVKPADVSTAKAGYDAALRGAKDGYDAQVAKAQADAAQARAAVDKARADAQQSVLRLPEVVQGQRAIDDRRDQVRREMPRDDETETLRRRLDNMQRSLDAFTMSNVGLGRTRPQLGDITPSAFRDPIIVRHDVAPFDPVLQHNVRHDVAPFDAPHISYNVPQPAFTNVAPRVENFKLQGPAHEQPNYVHPAIAAVMPSQQQPTGGVGQPQKVDVNSHIDVKGTVSGRADVAVTLSGTVMPSPLLIATVNAAKAAARADLTGGLETSYMDGPNGVDQHPTRGVDQVNAAKMGPR